MTIFTGIWRAKPHDDKRQWHWTWGNRHPSKHPYFSTCVRPHQQSWECREKRQGNSHWGSPQQTQHSYSSSDPETETGRSEANRSPAAPISTSWSSWDFASGFWCNSRRFGGRGRCGRRVGCDWDLRPSDPWRGYSWRLQVTVKFGKKKKKRVCGERGMKRRGREMQVLIRWAKGIDVKVALETLLSCAL